MRLRRDNDTLLLTLNALETHLLVQVLDQLALSYRLKPGELDAPTAAAWYSTRGCASANSSREDTEEWLENLHTFKCERLKKIEEWSASLKESKSSRAQFKVSLNDAPMFISSINDYRLMTAARHNIGEAEMAIHSPFELARTPGKRQEALLEIHFLAWVIEEALRAMQESS